MLKRDLLKLIEDVPLDGHIVIQLDGGDYWGTYLDEPFIVVQAAGKTEIGHPGGTQQILDINGVFAIIKSN